MNTLAVEELISEETLNKLMKNPVFVIFLNASESDKTKRVQAVQDLLIHQNINNLGKEIILILNALGILDEIDKALKQTGLPDEQKLDYQIHSILKFIERHPETFASTIEVTSNSFNSVTITDLYNSYRLPLIDDKVNFSEARSAEVNALSKERDTKNLYFSYPDLNFDLKDYAMARSAEFQSSSMIVADEPVFPVGHRYFDLNDDLEPEALEELKFVDSLGIDPAQPLNIKVDSSDSLFREIQVAVYGARYSLGLPLFNLEDSVTQFETDEYDDINPSDEDLMDAEQFLSQAEE
jgi:hypothetical protein